MNRTNIFIDVLKEKYNLNDQGKPIENEKENKKDFDIKKSGLFTGQKSSLTYQANNINHQVNHSLNKNKNSKKIKDLNYLNEEAIKKLNEDSSVTYNRNVIGLNGAKRSAVPHVTMQKTVSKLTPNKPKEGRVPSELNTKWGADNLRKKINLIYKLAKIQRQ